jgi:hypothetical protein
MIRGFSGSCNTGWRRVDVEDRRKAALNFSMVKRPCERRHHRSNGRLSLSGYQAICRFWKLKRNLKVYKLQGT